MQKFTVNPNGYTWTWRINAQTYVGVDEVELEVGSYTIEIVGGIRFSVEITSAGVTSNIGTYSATLKTLTFNTEPVKIDLNGYQWSPGHFGILNGPKLIQNEEPILTLVFGATYRFMVARGAGFSLVLDGNGVVIENDSVKPTSDGMILKVMDMTVDDSGYEWVPDKFGISYGPQLVKGPNAKLTIVKGVRYSFDVANAASFLFSVAKDGYVSVHSSSAVGGMESIQLQTAMLTFTPVDPKFSVLIDYGPKLTVEGTLKLVRAVGYTARINGEETKLSVDIS